MSTAKSMAAQYKRQLQTRTATPNSSRFKSSTSNLNSSTGNTGQRLKSTSMTNLMAAPGEQASAASKIQRPVSRNALDNIHMGMNAKYAQVQSKVLLQNIRPQQQQASKSSNEKAPATGKQAAAASHAFRKTNLTPTLPSRGLVGSRTTTSGQQQPQTKLTNQQQQQQQQGQLDKSQLVGKIKQLEEELAKQEELNEELKGQLERDKQDLADHLQALKLELQEKIGEHERQSEDYHQKLVEAYELADQNRRAADSVLSESRQRDEQQRKRIEELEQQLAELKEFVAMKEEMAGKMSELREQIRDERERYEEKTRSLNQMFENEKISSSHMQVDQNSNYFKRVKSSLGQSVESVDKLPADGDNLGSTTRPGQLNGGGGSRANGQHNNYQSEQDLYGSKLSTRMHDTARSAWKLSRKFASSVITGSVGGLSACRRQCTRRRSSASFEQPQQHQNLPAPGGLVGQRNGTMVDTSPRIISVNHGDSTEEHLHHENNVYKEQQVNSNEDEHQQHHMRVIKVGTNSSDEQQHQMEQPTGKCDSASSAIVIQHQPTSSAASSQADQQSPAMRVDEKQKLTIVTKFTDLSAADQLRLAGQAGGSSSAGSSWSPSSPNHSNHSGQQQQLQQQHQQRATPVNCCNERLRCESSSSGRGTSDSSSSSASCQNDADLLDQCQLEANNNNNNTGNTNTNSQTLEQHQVSPNFESNEHKRHKRKSSLSKTKRILSGSQASLNKLRSFFAVVGSNKPTTKSPVSRQQSRASVATSHSDGQIFREMLNQSLPSSRGFDIGALEQQQSQKFHVEKNGQQLEVDGDEQSAMQADGHAHGADHVEQQEKPSAEVNAPAEPNFHKKNGNFAIEIKLPARQIQMES